MRHLLASTQCLCRTQSLSYDPKPLVSMRRALLKNAAKPQPQAGCRPCKSRCPGQPGRRWHPFESRSLAKHAIFIFACVAYPVPLNSPSHAFEKLRAANLHPASLHSLCRCALNPNVLCWQKAIPCASTEQLWDLSCVHACSCQDVDTAAPMAENAQDAQHQSSQKSPSFRYQELPQVQRQLLRMRLRRLDMQPSHSLVLLLDREVGKGTSLH